MFSLLCLLFAASLQTATWGGEHVRMDVTATGATLEFDCARGTISEPVPAKAGTFTVKGTFTPERSGPTRGDGPPAIAATYSGTIKGDTMTLQVVLDGSTAEPPHFVLVQGSEGNVRKCR